MDGSPRRQDRRSCLVVLNRPRIGGGFDREGGDEEQGGESGHGVGLSGRELGSADLQTEMAARDAAAGGRRLHAPPGSPIQDSAIFVVKSGKSPVRFKDSAILKSRRLRDGAFEGMSKPPAGAGPRRGPPLPTPQILLRPGARRAPLHALGNGCGPPSPPPLQPRRSADGVGAVHGQLPVHEPLGRVAISGPFGSGQRRRHRMVDRVPQSVSSWTPTGGARAWQPGAEHDTTS